MPIRTAWLPTLLGVAVALAGCNANTDDGEADAIIRSVRYEVPIPNSENEFDPDRVLAISSVGVLSLDGQALDGPGIARVLDAARTDGRDEIAVLPDPRAKFVDVVERLQVVAKDKRIAYVFEGTEDHRSFGGEPGQKRSRGLLPAFRGSFGEYDMPVVVGYRAEEDECIAALGDSIFNSDELYDRSFKHLDSFVQAAGGIEAVMDRLDQEPGFVLPVAHVQAQSGTPWRCVAGVTYLVGVAGFPSIQFEATRD